MNSSILTLIALSFSVATQVFAAIPVATFEMQPNNKSYHFTLSNSGNAVIKCKKIVIETEIGETTCSEPITFYRIAETDVQLAPGENRVNPTFGLDYLHQQNIKPNRKQLIYCGFPTIHFTCN